MPEERLIHEVYNPPNGRNPAGFYYDNIRYEIPPGDRLIVPDVHCGRNAEVSNPQTSRPKFAGVVYSARGENDEEKQDRITALQGEVAALEAEISGDAPEPAESPVQTLSEPPAATPVPKPRRTRRSTKKADTATDAVR